jgi:hypothetical protein
LSNATPPHFDWDIRALRLTSLNPEARTIRGSSERRRGNFYEFYVDLKNWPGWAQFLAKLNDDRHDPGNFKYGGWAER